MLDLLSCPINFARCLYFQMRIYYFRKKILYNRERYRRRYGDLALARMIAAVDQQTQSFRDQIRALLQELDDEHDLLVQQGKAAPLSHRFVDIDLTVE